MAYTPVTSVQQPSLLFFQWAQPDAPNPRLANAITASDTTLVFTDPPLDHNNAVVTSAFLMGIRSLEDGYVETIYVPAGTLSVDGLTATGVVRGIRLEGLDVTTGDPNKARAFNEGDPIFCNISGAIGAIFAGGLTAGVGADIKFNARNQFQDIGILNDRNFADATARDAAIPSPQNGDSCYLSSLGMAQDYLAGAWVTRAAGGTFPNAAPGTAGKVDLATNAEYLAGTSLGSSGARLVPPNDLALVTESANFFNTTNITGAEAETLTDGSNADALHTHATFGFGSTASGEIIIDILGETVVADQLLYRNPTDMKWYKVTSSASTWYNQLGIVLEAGNNGDSKHILLKGKLGGQTFNNINPTFTATQAGDALNVVGSSAADAMYSFLTIDNTNGAEAILNASGHTIRARAQGSPAGNMQIYLILEQQEQASTPAAFRDTSNNVARGAIIASTTISSAVFSGVLADIAFSFGGTVKIPAGAKVYTVVAMTTAVSGVNYYIVGGQASQKFNQTTQTWSGSIQTGYMSFSVSSTSPIGYAVKAYTGSNGSYGLTPSNPWSRIIGKVISSTEMYFDPEFKKSSMEYAGNMLSNTSGNGLNTITTNFCPSSLRINVASVNDADFRIASLRKGFLRGDVTYATTNSFVTNGVDQSTPDSFLGITTGVAFNGSIEGASSIVLSGSTNTAQIAINCGPTPQNRLYAVRLENGYHLYNGYPTGTSNLSAGRAGFNDLWTSFEIESKV